MRITRCRVNHLENPLGYELRRTTFSWQVEEATGKRQTASRLVVRCGGDVIADTGWADLDSLATPINLLLTPRTRYTWTVAVRTDAGEEAVSEENWFETALMEEPWQAAWIGCDDTEPRHPIFSKEIAPEGTIQSARLYICGLGLYEAAYNGHRIGAEHLTPYCNDYNEWVQYQTYDVTDALQTAGTLQVTLGNGWYKGRYGFDRNPKPYYGDSWRLLAQLHITYADGRTEVIGTDESWQVARSNITFSNIYDGEQRNDTLPLIPAVPARLVDAPKGTLCARYSTPVETYQEVAVKELLHTPAGETVLDLGQNLTGGFRLRVHVPAGQTVHLQFGEILQSGNFYRENLRSARAEYVYVSDGESHTLEPRFTFYGYRYVKVEGIEGLQAEDYTALVWHSLLPRTGTMTTGHELVNQLISNIGWGQIGNFLDVPTDCPQRDERMGWTGDAQVFSAAACYQRDSYAFYAKYLHDMSLEQRTLDGMVPDVVPSFGKDGCSAAWGDAACVIPWTLYEFYGDKAILEAQYDAMTAWIQYIERLDGDDHAWRRRYHYGDWLALDGTNEQDLRGGTEVGYVADTQYRHSVLLTAKAARVLGRTEDAARYEALAERILQGIREEYYTPTGRCAIPTQTAALLGLQDDTAPNQDRTWQDLTELLQNHGGMLRTGFVGTPLLCPTLTAGGNSEMAFSLLLNEEYPGWLYAVKLGATTIWERWNSVAPDGTIAENGMNSLNHYAYGSIMAWLYRDVAGIAPAEPGFRKATLAPHVDVHLGRVVADYCSAAGTWLVEWEILPNDEIRYCCKVPFGCTATLTLPYGGGAYALEAGEFERTYIPDRPLRKRLSSYTPLGILMRQPAARALLVKIVPMIEQVPPSMENMSMRDLAARMGNAQTEMMDQLDTLLAAL